MENNKTNETYTSLYDIELAKRMKDNNRKGPNENKVLIQNKMKWSDSFYH